jgi:hypothetical protein
VDFLRVASASARKASPFLRWAWERADMVRVWARFGMRVQRDEKKKESWREIDLPLTVINIQ